MSIYRETQVAHAPRTALAIEFASSIARCSFLSFRSGERTTKVQCIIDEGKAEKAVSRRYCWRIPQMKIRPLAPEERSVYRNCEVLDPQAPSGATYVIFRS